jgi:hypothetical protein
VGLARSHLGKGSTCLPCSFFLDDLDTGARATLTSLYVTVQDPVSDGVPGLMKPGTPL